MTTIKVSAPGKTVLHGEHSVVYGKAAIAASLGLRTTATYNVEANEGVVILKLKLLNFKVQWTLESLKNLESHCEVSKNDSIDLPSEKYLQDIGSFIRKTDSLPESTTEFQRLAVTIFLFLYTNMGCKYSNGFSEPCVVSVDSELSVGAGMGSSASYSVCLAAVLLTKSRKITELLQNDKEVICRWAYCAETICHGSPSGMDNSICTYGGALLFQSGKICSTLTSIPPLKILLVDSGVPRNTKKLVEKVSEKMKRHPEPLKHVLNVMDSITQESWLLLQKMTDIGKVDEHIASLQELVEMNQHLLNTLGVGHPKLDMICGLAQKYHHTGKLTGAGGGGCAIILVSSDSETASLKAELTSEGFKFWDVTFGGSGVEININETNFLN